MQALSEANSPITEVVSFPPSGGFMPMGVFVTTPSRALLVAQRFGLLTKLRLALEAIGDDSYIANGSVAHALSAAVNLRTLCIEAQGSGHISPQGPVIGTW